MLQCLDAHLHCIDRDKDVLIEHFIEMLECLYAHWHWIDKDKDVWVEHFTEMQECLSAHWHWIDKDKDVLVETVKHILIECADLVAVRNIVRSDFCIHYSEM